MRIILLPAVFFLCVFSFSLYAQGQQNRTVDKDRAVKTVRFLSETNFPRSSPHNKTQTIQFIAQSLAASGFKTECRDFAVKQILCAPVFPDSQHPENAAIELYSETFTNIHAFKKGTTDSRIIVGAHYDTVLQSPGADDNAAAVAVLIELAFLLNSLAELNCDIELVAYDLEESGLLGSRYHAAAVKQAKNDVVCMICLDMVGYYSDADNSQDYPIGALSWLYGTKGDFLVLAAKPKDADLLTRVHNAFQNGTNLKTIPFPVPIGLEILLSRSDHGYFWNEGIPALFLTDTAEYRNKNYHRSTDVWNTLDYNRLMEVPVGLFQAIQAISKNVKP